MFTSKSKFLNSHFCFFNMPNFTTMDCLYISTNVDHWLPLLHWRAHTWAIVEASERGLKLTTYWFTAEESPGQLFEGIRLTDNPSWVLYPRALNFNILINSSYWSFKVSNTATCCGQNDRMCLFLMNKVCTSEAMQWKHQAIHDLRVKPQTIRP